MEALRQLGDAVRRLKPDPDERAKTNAEGQLVAATGTAQGWINRAKTAAEIADAQIGEVRALLAGFTEAGIVDTLDSQIVKDATSLTTDDSNSS